MVEQYLDALNKMLSTKTTVARQTVRNNKLKRSGSLRYVLRYLSCYDRGVDCPSRASTSMGVGAQNHLGRGGGGETNFTQKILQRTTSIMPDTKIDV